MQQAGQLGDQGHATQVPQLPGGQAYRGRAWRRHTSLAHTQTSSWLPCHSASQQAFLVFQDLEVSGFQSLGW